MKRIRKAYSVAVAVFVLGVAFSTGGCRTSPETVLAREQSPVCPECRNETRKVEAADASYKVHACPKCRGFLKVEDPNRWAEVREYTVIHVCDACEKIVEECPQCAQERHDLQ